MYLCIFRLLNQQQSLLLFIAMKPNETDILLIEDNPGDRELFIKALQKSRITNKIEIAEDGKKALELLFEPNKPLRPKLIILDLGLPQISGLEILKQIRNHPDIKNIPVVIFTGSNKETDKISTLAEGVNSFITKPVDFYKFTECVKEISLHWLQLNQTNSNE